MKKMIMCLLISALVVNASSCQEKKATKSKAEAAWSYYYEARNRDVAKAVGVLGFGWTTLGFGGFANLKLPQAQKLLKSARISRAIGCVGMAPFVSFLAGYPVYRLGFNANNNAVENLGRVIALPVIAMVFVPADWLADKKNADKYAEYQNVSKK